MDATALKEQMKVLKNKAKAARAKGEHVVARQFASGASRLWRKVRQIAPAVAKKVEG